eukprot:5931109-Pleurochrysis_carterae.AAC.2
MPRASIAWCRGNTCTFPPSTRSSTASDSGMSPCGDSVAGRPPSLSAVASSPARPPKQRTAGRTPSLSLRIVSARTTVGPPRAVAKR